jgi:hypothetical protein
MSHQRKTYPHAFFCWKIWQSSETLVMNGFAIGFYRQDNIFLMCTAEAGKEKHAGHM